MEIVNIKTALTLRVKIGDRQVAFSTKAIRGERKGLMNVPEAKELVPYEVHSIHLSESSMPWYDLEDPIKIQILWSNVLSVQQEGI